MTAVHSRYIAPVLASLTRTVAAPSPAERTAFVWACLTGVIAYGAAMVLPVLRDDDYRWVTGLGYSRYGIMDAGRWLFYAWADAKNWQPMPVVSWVVQILSAAAAGLVLARLWCIRRPLSLTLAAALFVVNPFFIDFGTWDQMVGITGLAYGFGLLGILLAQASLAFLPVAAILIALTLSTYQAVLSFLIVVAVMQLMLMAARGATLGRLARTAAATLGAAVGGIAAYAGLTALALAAGAPFSRAGGGLSSPADWAERLVTGLGGAVVPTFTSSPLLLAALVLAGVLTILVFAKRKAAVAGVVVTAVAVLVAAVGSFAHQLASPEVIPSGWSVRALSGLYLVPLVALAAADHLDRGAFSAGAAALGGLLLVSWAHLSSTTVFEGHRETQANAMLVNRIFDRLESDPAFAPGLPLALPYGFPHEWLGKHHASAGPTAIFLYYNLPVAAPGPAGLEAAARMAPTMPLWPRAGSVVIRDGLAVVAMETDVSRAHGRTGAAPAPARSAAIEHRETPPDQVVARQRHQTRAAQPKETP